MVHRATALSISAVAAWASAISLATMIFRFASCTKAFYFDGWGRGKGKTGRHGGGGESGYYSVADKEAVRGWWRRERTLFVGRAPLVAVSSPRRHGLHAQHVPARNSPAKEI